MQICNGPSGLREMVNISVSILTFSRNKMELLKIIYLFYLFFFSLEVV